MLCTVFLAEEMSVRKTVTTWSPKRPRSAIVTGDQEFMNGSSKCRDSCSGSKTLALDSVAPGTGPVSALPSNITVALLSSRLWSPSHLNKSREAAKDLIPAGIPPFANYRRAAVRGRGKRIRERTAKVAVQSNGHFILICSRLNLIASRSDALSPSRQERSRATWQSCRYQAHLLGGKIL